MELGNRTKEFDVVGFGEIMLRLSPTGLERLSQCETLEKRPGGSELNVVSGISLLGLRTAVITKVPDNDMGRFIKNKIRFYGVSDDCLIYDQSDKKRIGIYYYESGAYPRKPAVMYDRAYSSINSISVDEINPAIYQDTRVFHTSGISLALSRNCRTAAVEMIKQFKAGGAAISFDVNYRANLWDEEEARKTIYEILPYVDVLFVSEPTRGIDIGAKKLVLEYLVKLNREEGMTVIIVSSELVELRSISDRIAIISDGKLACILKPDDSDAEYGLAMSGAYKKKGGGAHA